MYAQFFGNYLLSHGVVTREQLLETMHRKSSTKIKLGTLAIHAGYMTANEVDRIVILQTHEDKRFGELAIHEGYLTEEEVTKLLAEQIFFFSDRHLWTRDSSIISSYRS